MVLWISSTMAVALVPRVACSSCAPAVAAAEARSASCAVPISASERLAALLGALPLMLGRGVGAELRHPLGLVMVGGLLVSQVLTLFTTPVIYLAFDRLAKRFKGRTAASDGGGGLA